MRRIAPRLLLLDDDRDVRDALSECLRGEGYEVYAAAHGKAGLEMLEFGVRPEVIVLDLMMPVMSGFEFLSAVRARPEWQQIRVIVLSASRLHDVGDISASVFRFLRKPVEIESLCTAIELALGACQDR
jgi:two-component system chemotaxis response regulator CheY